MSNLSRTNDRNRQLRAAECQNDVELEAAGGSEDDEFWCRFEQTLEKLGLTFLCVADTEDGLPIFSRNIEMILRDVDADVLGHGFLHTRGARPSSRCPVL